MYYLQNRYQLEDNYIVYYGLKNKDELFQNKTKVNKKEIEIIKKLPSLLSKEEEKKVQRLLGKYIVKKDALKKVPTCFEEAKFCKNCIANDFMIPGLEFDEDGLCPMCQTQEETKNFKSVTPIMNVIPKSKKSRFDVAVFYTGGKDSTYLLYYLSKVLNLKVLSLTWEIPYMSECARMSIKNAKKKLENVEFITRKINDTDMKVFYKELYRLNENTCACPSLAYMLFYPELVANHIPYFVVGNEPVQMIGLYYNNMAPRISYEFANNKFLNFIINLGRIITFHPPYKKGQFQTMLTMKELAGMNKFVKKFIKYSNPLVENIVASAKLIPNISKPLKKAIRTSSRNGNIPAFIHVDLNDVCGGVYDWKKVKTLIEKECGWVGPENMNKGLHTSCNIEKCKEYSQFQRFYYMRSKMIPFSALEISLTSRYKNITREEAIVELKESLGFSLKEIPECKIMRKYLEDDE